MSVTNNLMNEHQLILKYIALMEQYTEHPDTAVLLATANQFIAFIREFADNFHHAKEENILFRYLVVPGVLTHCNPVPQMLHEHGKARELVGTMEQALTQNNVAALIVAITQYASLLREHIYKEDNILYPMAERGLSDADKALLQKEYAEAEQAFDSAAIWQQYQVLYEQLKNNLP